MIGAVAGERWSSADGGARYEIVAIARRNWGAAYDDTRLVVYRHADTMGPEYVWALPYDAFHDGRMVRLDETESADALVLDLRECAAIARKAAYTIAAMAAGTTP